MGGVVGGVLVLVLSLIFVALLVGHRRRGARASYDDNGFAAAQSGDQGGAQHYDGAYGQTHSWYRPHAAMPPGHIQSQPAQWPQAPREIAAHGIAAPHGSRPGGDSKMSYGQNLRPGAQKQELVAPAQRVKVACSPHTKTFTVTTDSSLSAVPKHGSAASSLTNSSSPAEVLDAQLDFIERHQAGMLTTSIRCALVCRRPDSQLQLCSDGLSLMTCVLICRFVGVNFQSSAQSGQRSWSAARSAAKSM